MDKTPHDNPTDDDTDDAMPLIEHLSELRDRLLRSIFAVLLVFAGLFYFSDDIYMVVSEPLRRLLPAGSSMIATEVASPFLAPFKLTLIISVFIAIPYILHQAWAFISPGMYRHEKRIALPVLLSSIVLFYSGIAFAYFVVFPLIFGFFTRVAPAGVQVMTDINAYLDFVLKLFFAFGIAFEIPVATVLAIWAGITTPEALSSKRPYVIVTCFVVGMLLTPPDIFSQTMLAVPVWLLFEAGVFFGRWVRRSRPDDEAEEENPG